MTMHSGTSMVLTCNRDTPEMQHTHTQCAWVVRWAPNALGIVLVCGGPGGLTTKATESFEKMDACSCVIVSCPSRFVKNMITFVSSTFHTTVVPETASVMNCRARVMRRARWAHGARHALEVRCIEHCMHLGCERIVGLAPALLTRLTFVS